MKKLWLAVAVLVSLAADDSVFAADLPAPIVKGQPAAVVSYSWAGFYIGIAGGGTWGRSKHISGDPGFPGDITGWYDVTGGLIGETLGWNWQLANWVLGLEGDFSWVRKRGSANDIPPFLPLVVSRTREFWLGTGRARLGVAPLDRWLLYATAGFAVADVEAVVDFSAYDFLVFSDRKIRWGWTAGGGVEAALDRHWSAKIEYLFVGLARTRYFDPPAVDVLTRRGNVPLYDHIVRLGINYKFATPGAVVAKY